MKLILALVLGAIAISGCEPRVDGCLDFRALDVDVTADDACPDCCEFPSLELNFVPIRFDTLGEPVFLLSTDTLISGSELGAEPQLGFYLHDIFLVTADGDRFEMQDTFTVFLTNGDPNFVYESSILRVTPFRQRGYELGTLLETQTFVAIEANLGLPDVLSAVNVDRQPAGSPLTRTTDSLLVSDEDDYLDMDFRYVSQAGGDSLVQIVDGLDQPIRWELPTPIVYEPSFNLIISLGLPVDSLLQYENGVLDGTVFAQEFLEQSEVLETFLSRS